MSLNFLWTTKNLKHNKWWKYVRKHFFVFFYNTYSNSALLTILFSCKKKRSKCINVAMQRRRSRI